MGIDSSKTNPIPGKKGKPSKGYYNKAKAVSSMLKKSPEAEIIRILGGKPHNERTAKEKKDLSDAETKQGHYKRNLNDLKQSSMKTA